jgi:hypothetical protein
MDEPRKTTKTLSRGSWCPDRITVTALPDSFCRSESSVFFFFFFGHSVKSFKNYKGNLMTTLYRKFKCINAVSYCSKLNL